MDDGVFGFAHVIFHVVLAAVLHARRPPQVFKTRREPKQKKSRNQPKVATKLYGRSQRRAEQ